MHFLSNLQCKEHAGIKISFDLPNFLVLVSPAFYMLSTEGRHHDVHVLFGDVYL